MFFAPLWKNNNSMLKLKRILIFLVLLILSFTVYVFIVNRNSTNMTNRQKVLKAIYPAFMWWTKLTGVNAKSMANENAAPPVSFYSLKTISINGEEYDFSQLKGKKVLIVNTASNCGYTDQYEQLQQLHEKFKNKLIILGFPSNDFKEQEKGTDQEIAQFCKANFGVTFPLMKKSSVIKTPAQNNIFHWLSDSSNNGWNQKEPSWNFSKYIINEQGVLTNYFDPSISPLSEEVINAIKK